MEEQLKTQVGGNHYAILQMQPVDFIVRAKLSYIQGNIVKYLSRYKYKNGKQDLEKAWHYANLAIELNSMGPTVRMVGLAYSYCRANDFSATVTNVIVSCVQDDYYASIRYIKKLIKDEYESI